MNDSDWGSDEWFARFEKEQSDSAEKILSAAANFDIVHFRRHDGMQLFLHQTSNSGPNAWQVTWVAKDDTPLSDTLFKKREDAPLSIAGAGRTPNAGTPGEWDVIETRNIRKIK